MTKRRFGAIGDRARLERAAVDQQRCARDAASRDVLVHDAAAHADEVVLGALADLGDRDRVEGQARGGEERMGDADFERRRGAQARSERHVAPDDQVGAAEPPAALFDHGRDAEHVVRPVVPAARRGSIEVELARFVHEQGMDADLAVRAGRAGDEGGEIERRRHDETVVVVGVLADQVHPAGRAADHARAAEAQAELLRDVARLDRQRRHGAALGTVNLCASGRRRHRRRRAERGP